jgi:hypothetical protein
MCNQVRGFHSGVRKLFIAKTQMTFPNCADITVDFTKLWPRQLQGWLGIWEL